MSERKEEKLEEVKVKKRRWASWDQPPPEAKAAKDPDDFNDESFVWVGNVPMGTTLADLVGFLNGALLTAGSALDSSSSSAGGLPVVSCRRRLKIGGLDGDVNGYGYLLQLRSPNLFQICAKLNGIPFSGTYLIIGRPSQYVDRATPPLPDAVPTASAVSEAVGAAAMLKAKLSAGQTSGFSSDHKVYIQDLPIDIPDQQVTELLEQFGKLRVMHILRDPTTNVSKGYGFFEYEDAAITDFAIQALNGFACGRNILKVQRSTFTSPAAVESAPASRALVTSLPDSMTRRLLADPLLEIQVRGGRKTGEKPSNVVQLINAVLLEDLVDDEDYAMLMRELQSEAATYGPVRQVVVPRPAIDLTYRQGVGKVFLHYDDITAARKAQLMLNGRRFDGRQVVCAAFYPLDKFLAGQYIMTQQAAS
eukprot:GHVS01030268.1.p1 GENE.GHVS01030268.1~~GHVS01030268.1.p1  ORF type:complete len:420 (+),score=85.23 GHVS01030268.1:34-1293(+)